MARKDQRQASVARTTRPRKAAAVLTMADVLRELGDVAPERVCVRPPPGQATERDLIRIRAREKRNCELVDGILVEKIMGAPESCLTLDLNFALHNYSLASPGIFADGRGRKSRS